MKRRQDEWNVGSDGAKELLELRYWRGLESGMPVGGIIWGLHLSLMRDLGRLETRTSQERCRNGEENVLDELHIY